MAEALAETRRFLADKSAQALIPLSPTAYFGVIIFMGVSLSLGAGLYLLKRRGGLSLIALYLATHGWLFANFQTINPKIAVLGLGGGNVAGAGMGKTPRLAAPMRLGGT